MTRFFLRLAFAVFPIAISIGDTAAADEAESPGAAIAKLARGSEGKKFGGGECWDFVTTLLDQTGCAWEKPFHFGRQLETRKESLQPGDILQFESVKIEWRRGNRFGTVFLGFPNHTAIVLSAKGSAVEIAHQNYNRIREVKFMTIDLKDVKKGKWTAYRPVKKSD